MFYKNKIIIIFILLIANHILLYSQKKTNIDSLKKLVDTTLANVNDTNKVNTINILAWEIRNKEPENAFKYLNIAIDISIKIKYIKGEAESYKTYGSIYYSQSKYPDAYDYYTKSLVIFKQIGDLENAAKVTRNLGSIFHQQADYEKALNLFFESLEMRIQLKDTSGEASIYNAIGLVFLEQGDGSFDKALEYFNKSLFLYKQLKDTIGIANSCFRIGGVYIKYKNAKTKKALIYFKKFKYFAKINNDPKQIVLADEAIGHVYQERDDIDNALIYYYLALEGMKNLNNQFGVANSYINIASCYEKKDIKNAITFNLMALDIISQIGATSVEKNICESLNNLYKKNNDINNAYTYLSKYVILSDSLKLDEVSNKISIIEMQREFDKKLKEKELIEIKNNSQLKQQKIIIFSFIGGIVLLLALFVVIARSYKLMHEKNNKITEQNKALQLQYEEISAQRDEIETQRNEIEKQRDIVILQRDKIDFQNQQIKDSIKYARQIQHALLPPDDFISELFPEMFIMYKPRDIVSGDFYWIGKRNKYKLICCADCTGHGVPGAFMSMLGISFLNEILKHFQDEINANQILNKLRESVKKSLHQVDFNSSSKDGMDLSLCVIDTEKNIVQYAGANNPIFYVSGNNLKQYAPDKVPIGVYIKEIESFTNNEIPVQKGDIIYMFTDGIIDQFGGIDGKKYMIRNFRNFISNIHNKPLAEQNEIIDNELNEWLHPSNNKKHEQTDDITVLAFKI